jgi:hypothetical protein
VHLSSCTASPTILSLRLKSDLMSINYTGSASAKGQ